MKSAAFIPCITLLFLSSLFAEESKRVLVRNFKSNSVDSTELSSITNLFANELRNYPQYNVLSFEEATTLADQYGTTVLFSCESDEDLEIIANAVDAPYIVSGEINYVGTRYVANIAILNVDSATTEKTVSEIASSLDSIIDLMPEIALEISGGKKAVVTSNSESNVQSGIENVGNVIIDFAVGVRDKSRELIDALSEEDEK